MPLITSNNLNSVQVVSAQDNQFQTFNDKVGEHDSFLTEILIVDVSSGNVTITSDQYIRYRKIKVAGNTTAGRSITLQAVKRPILIDNSYPANTQSIAIALGSTTLNLAVGQKARVETDGTTNGLEFEDIFQTTSSGIVPQTSESADYTLLVTDAGHHIYHPSSDNNPRTFTINSNAAVPYTVGTCITFVNEINTVTIAITSDTLTLAGTGATGSRTLAASGIATALKVASTKWVISGTGLS